MTPKEFQEYTASLLKKYGLTNLPDGAILGMVEIRHGKQKNKVRRSRRRKHNV